MTAGRGGNGNEPLYQEPEPTPGLRLRGLPAASEPAFAIEHDYFEIVYAPLIGPTAILLARAMVRHIDAAGGPTTVCPIELAREVGIRSNGTDPLGKKSRLVNTIDRLAHGHIVARQGDRVLGVRVAVPPVSARALEKLPAPARDAHDLHARPRRRTR